MMRNLLRVLAAIVALTAIAPQPASSWLIQAGVDPTCPPTDSNFASVVLLAHLDNSLTDNSTPAHTLTIFNAAGFDSTTKKFGSASLQTSNTIMGVTTADSGDWDFGSGQFTIEAWDYRTAATTSLRAIVTQWGLSGNRSWFLGWDASGHLIFEWTTNGSTINTLTTSYTPTLSSFNYVGVTRDVSNNLSLWANGVQQATSVVGSTIFNGTAALNVANANDGAQTNGTAAHFDDVRITKGVSRDLSVVPTCAFPNS